MPTYSDLVATILTETLACQDPGTPRSKTRDQSRYGPFGPHIPGDSGIYPTTDAAMEALADLADRYGGNDAALSRSVSRDALWMLASRVVGELLNELAREHDATKHWLPMVRDRMRARVQDIIQDIVHYVPVWLFLGQECAPFDIGPVRFIERKDWLAMIAARRGQESSWMPGVRAIWSGRKLRGRFCWVGLKAGARAALRTPTSPSAWAGAFKAARDFSRPPAEQNARTIARTVHPDQWIACVDVSGFERDESRRRAVLAAGVALDTLRLTLPGKNRRLLSTAADSVVPLSVERLSQISGQDLAHGWRFNRPGLGGPPGMAQGVINQSTLLFEAGGACIAAAATSAADAHHCPKLADRWFNAVHSERSQTTRCGARWI